MASDRLKGQVSKATGPLFGYNSNGGLRGSAPMGTQSQGSVTPVMRTGKGSVNSGQVPSRVMRSMSGNPSSGIKSAPITTHIADGAIAQPRKSGSMGGVVRGRAVRRRSPNSDAGKY
jgi:hypothetical protein